MKIDLHCHSKYSSRPTLWLMKKLGCPESFTEPLELYQLLRLRGMDAVTITDHNVIDGALEIAELEGAFLSCEYTTYFPRDRCKVHILAYDITEAQHDELTRARENIFDFVDYMQANSIVHVCAHPLFWVNDKLTVEHIEQLVLLFKNWEVNGDVCKEMNVAALDLLANLTPAAIARYADKHGFSPRDPKMWVKNVTSGSDDHSSLNLGRAYTEVAGAANLQEFWAGVSNGKSRARCPEASPHMLARNYYGVAYQFYRNKLGLERKICKDVSLRFLDQTLKAHVDGADTLMNRIYLRFAQRRRIKPENPGPASLLDLARAEVAKKVRGDSRLTAIMREGPHRGGDLDSAWFELVHHIGDQLLLIAGKRFIDCAVNARLFDTFASAGAAGALYLFLAPYLVSYALFARQRRWSEDVLRSLFPDRSAPAKARAPRLAHFTDTFHDVNGVAQVLQQEMRLAAEAGKEYHVITCHRESDEQRRGLHQFVSVGAYTIPEYEGLELQTPPVLQMLHHCYEEDYTHFHIATPGTVGLAGLAIARILKVPVCGTYHTSLPQYAKTFTEDGFVEDLMWRYMLWFYDQMDIIFVPSKATGEELVAKGISGSKIEVIPRGIDTDRFHPRWKDRSVFDGYGVSRDAAVLLYVGRISREKNLAVLGRMFRALAQTRPDVCLVVVGDGPYRPELEEALAGTPVVFTGFQEGATLAALYASADFMVMPSVTETFGNVVMEAQASGLPIVVCKGGGASENVVDGRTGFIVEADSAEALSRAAIRLLDDIPLRERMAAAARKHIETRGCEMAFENLWDLYVRDIPRDECTSDFDAFAQAFTNVVSRAS